MTFFTDLSMAFNRLTPSRSSPRAVSCGCSTRSTPLRHRRARVRLPPPFRCLAMRVDCFSSACSLRVNCLFTAFTLPCLIPCLMPSVDLSLSAALTPARPSFSGFFVAPPICLHTVARRAAAAPPDLLALKAAAAALEEEQKAAEEAATAEAGKQQAAQLVSAGRKIMAMAEVKTPIRPQSEAIRAIVSEDSPCIGSNAD